MATTKITSDNITDGAITSAKLDTNIAVGGTLGVTGAITSTSTTGLHVDSSSSYARVDLESTNNRFFLQVEDTDWDGFGIYDGNNSAWRMSVLTNGNVGIGTTDADSKLKVELKPSGTVLAGLRVGYNGTSVNYLDGDTNIFRNGLGNTERMTLDTSGNLLVGTSNTTWNSAEGLRYFNGNALIVTRNADAPLFLNRLSSDGAIAEFTKDGTTVGSIGVSSGAYLTIGTGDTGILFDNVGNRFYPCNASTQANLDNAIDIGASNVRFKDLYLSGTMLGNITKLRQTTYSMYVSPTNTNTLNGNLDADSDSADMWINYRGYQDSFSRFRDFRIGNGKGAQIVFVDGSANSVAITGSLSVTSAFSKGSGSFKIDHPLEAKKDTHHLIHSFVEAPQADNIYRGKVDLVAGSATANIDTVAGMTEGTFVALNREVQCFTTNESNWDAVKGSVSGNILTIESENSESTATISWLVIGERKDQHMYDTDWTDDDGKVIVEPLKSEEIPQVNLENA